MFSDEDLKRFKEKCKDLYEGDPTGYFGGERLMALLARMEAAEKVAERFAALISIAMEIEEISKLSKIELDQRFYRVMIAKDDVEAWRKSKGEK